MTMDQNNKTILVVEDEQALATAIKKKLELSGFEVVSARSVDQALAYLQDVPSIVCIWLDHYLLGKESGIDLVAKVKEEGSVWQKIPIFVVSNTASPDKVQAYLRLGINKYFTKSDYRLDQIINDLVLFLKNGE